MHATLIAYLCSAFGGAKAGRLHALEEIVMHYLTFVTAINPYVLAALGMVLICGAVDWWRHTH
jgi:hypothetical protein